MRVGEFTERFLDARPHAKWFTYTSLLNPLSVCDIGTMIVPLSQIRKLRLRVIQLVRDGGRT